MLLRIITTLFAFLVLFTISTNSIAATVHIDCGRYNDQGVVIYINSLRIGECPIGYDTKDSDISVNTRMILKDGRELVGKKRLELATGAIKTIMLPIRVVETFGYKLDTAIHFAEKLSLHNEMRSKDDLKLFREKVKKSGLIARNKLNNKIEELNTLSYEKWKSRVVPIMYMAWDLYRISCILIRWFWLIINLSLRIGKMRNERSHL